MPSPEILASGKIIPTSRKQPHTSPQARKVSPEFVSSEDEKSSETDSPEDKKSLDITDNKLKPNFPDAMIEHPDSENILEKMTTFKKNCKMLEMER